MWVFCFSFPKGEREASIWNEKDINEACLIFVNKREEKVP